MDDDGDDKDDTKRRTRNLSEKKRRDQFNTLVQELSTMLSANSRKMDKSTVLKSTISFLKSYNEVTVRSRAHDVQEEWKPAFLSNEEFTYLVLEALEGFVMVFSSTGRICYVSESIISILGLNPAKIVNKSIFDYTCEEDRPILYNVLQRNVAATEQVQSLSKDKEMITFELHLKRGGLDLKEEIAFELITFNGHFRNNYESINGEHENYQQDMESSILFVGTGRLHRPQLIRDVSLVDSSRSDFTSRHSLEWKFLFLDHRAPPIIGYLPFEVLGTSGYDYYHFDDLEKVLKCHEELMEKGVLVSEHYRFLTKGQQWIWLQTRFFISYHQWNSKPEFVVCNHKVISYGDRVKAAKAKLRELENTSEAEIDGSVKQAPSEDATLGNMSPSYMSEASDAFGSSYRTHSPVDRRSMKDDATMPPLSPSYMSEASEAYASSYHSNSQAGSKRQRLNESVLSDDAGMAPMSPSYMSEASETFPAYTRMHSQTASVKSSGSAQEASWRRSRRYATGSDTGSLSGESQSSARHSRERRHHSGRYDRGSVLQHTHKGVTSSITPQHGIGAQYLDPVPYVGVPAVPAVLPMPVRSVPVIVSQDQAQIQEQLQRKHEELQQMIVRQQEELQQVKEQLLLARLGMLQPVINVPYSNAEQPQPQQQLQMNQAPPQPQIIYEQGGRAPILMSYPPPHAGQPSQSSQAPGPQNRMQ